MIVVVSPTSAPCSVTATIAPVSMSTACSALCARCVRPSFIFVTFASGSWGFVQSVFEVFFFRFRSSRARPSRVGGLDPRGRRETRQKRLVALAGVPADDAAHRRVRLERRGVNRDGLTRQPAGLDESLLHPT